MKIENPFENGHIKNYLMAYVSVVVIMVLFFIASTLFYEAEQIDKKEFEAKKATKPLEDESQKKDDSNSSWTSGIKIMDKNYK